MSTISLGNLFLSGMGNAGKTDSYKLKSDSNKFSALSEITSGGASGSANFAGASKISSGSLSKSITANTLWQTQSYAQSDDSKATDAEVLDEQTSKSSDTQTAEEKYSSMMNKSPEQLMRDAVLRECGYTEESLKAMSPEDRAKAEEKIKAVIKEKINENLRKKGIDVDGNSQSVQMQNSPINALV